MKIYYSLRRIGAGAMLSLITFLALGFASSNADARAVVRGPRGGVAVAGPRGVAAAGPNRAAVRRGYVRTIPGGYRRVMYRGAAAYYVNGVYTRLPP